MRPNTPPVALTIAGSDPSGGAGIQADLKSFSALGAYGCAALTALTAQNTQGVTGVHAVPAEFVTEQVETLVADVRLDTVKVGMLGAAPVVDAVRELIGHSLTVPVVVDPVMVSTSGSRLLEDDAVEAMRRLVLKADLITPNLHEAAVLLNAPVAADLAEQEAQAKELVRAGAARVLLKGGHGQGPHAVDVYVDQEQVRHLSQPRVATRNTHGTGCSLSAAIAALLPRYAGEWVEAIAHAKTWLTRALQASDALDIGAGPGPVHHFHAWWSTAAELSAADDPRRKPAHDCACGDAGV